MKKKTEDSHLIKIIKRIGLFICSPFQSCISLENIEEEYFQVNEKNKKENSNNKSKNYLKINDIDFEDSIIIDDYIK